MVKGPSTAGITRATGRAWQDWVAALDDDGAAALDHAGIVQLARDQMPAPVENPEWWSQSVAVAYEQHHGLRQPGQNRSGQFQTSASKTFPGDKAAALQAWEELVAERDSFAGVPLQGEPSTSVTPRWRYWRAALADGSRVAVTISDKSPGKATVGVNHTKLDSAEAVDRWKVFWRELLAGLQPGQRGG